MLIISAGGALTATLVALIANAGHENQAVATAGQYISASYLGYPQPDTAVDQSRTSSGL